MVVSHAATRNLARIGKNLSEQKPFSKSVIMAGLLILSIFPLANVGGFGGDPCGTPKVRLCGSNLLTIAANTQQAQTTVTFSTAFNKIPNVTITPATIISKNAQVIAFLPFCFLCATSPGQTWTNMPAALTEIFGDQNHRVFENPQGGFQSTSTAFFTVFCINPSNSATAFLKVQYSTDGGVTFTDFDTTGTSNHLDISSVGPCAFGNAYVQTTINSFPTFAFNQGFYMRVVGVNGGAVGDNPQFNMVQITIEWQAPFLITLSATATATTKISFIITLRTNIQVATPTSQTITWTATT
jgi:hypothetical protein